jgi:hypothetical protein
MPRRLVGLVSVRPSSTLLTRVLLDEPAQNYFLVMRQTAQLLAPRQRSDELTDPTRATMPG